MARRDGSDVSATEPVVAFAPSYFFYSTLPCDELVQPGPEFSDAVANLEGEKQCLNSYLSLCALWDS